MRGYSQSIVEANHQADSENIGVLLGRLCILQKIPVSVVAEELELSRQTIYDWFSGKAIPAKERESSIVYLIQRLTEKN